MVPISPSVPCVPLLPGTSIWTISPSTKSPTAPKFRTSQPLMSLPNRPTSTGPRTELPLPGPSNMGNMDSNAAMAPPRPSPPCPTTSWALWTTPNTMCMYHLTALASPASVSSHSVPNATPWTPCPTPWASKFPMASTPLVAPPPISLSNAGTTSTTVPTIMAIPMWVAAPMPTLALVVFTGTTTPLPAPMATTRQSSFLASTLTNMPSTRCVSVSGLNQPAPATTPSSRWV